MNREIWKIVESQQNDCLGECSFVKLIEGSNGDLEIIVLQLSSKQLIRVSFAEHRVCSHRITETKNRLKTTNLIKSQCGDKWKTHLLFLTFGSSYHDWFNKESYDIYKDFSWKHFAIVTKEKIIDVIGSGEPKIDFEVYST